MLLSSYTKFVLLISLLLLVQVSLSHIRKSRAAKFKGNSIAKNLPQRQVLDVYLKHLKMIVKFGMKHQKLIDMNMYFGLFLVNVNLEGLIKHKERTMPPALRLQVIEILKNNEKLLAAFKSQVEKDKNPKNKMDKMIFNLFSSVKTWVERLRSYPAVLSQHMFYQTPEELSKTYSTWDKYVRKIDNVEMWIPQPELSDTCLSQLVQFKLKSTSPNTIPKCQFKTKECYEMLINGSDFGYALSHRILMLLIARYGRGCSVFEPAMDRELTKRFCAAAFSEAEYIAMHGFQAVDLMLEQMALCALDRHTEFLSHPWIQTILQYQTPHGCFYMKKYHDKRMRSLWRFSKKKPDILNGHCNSHMTGVAAATLGAVCRLLIVTYY